MSVGPMFTMNACFERLLNHLLYDKAWPHFHIKIFNNLCSYRLKSLLYNFSTNSNALSPLCDFQDSFWLHRCKFLIFLWWVLVIYSIFERALLTNSWDIIIDFTNFSLVAKYLVQLLNVFHARDDRIILSNVDISHGYNFVHGLQGTNDGMLTGLDGRVCILRHVPGGLARSGPWAWPIAGKRSCTWCGIERLGCPFPVMGPIQSTSAFARSRWGTTPRKHLRFVLVYVWLELLLGPRLFDRPSVIILVHICQAVVSNGLLRFSIGRSWRRISILRHSWNLLGIWTWFKL